MIHHTQHMPRLAIGEAMSRWPQHGGSQAQTFEDRHEMRLFSFKKRVEWKRRWASPGWGPNLQSFHKKPVCLRAEPLTLTVRADLLGEWLTCGFEPAGRTRAGACARTMVSAG